MGVQNPEEPQSQFNEPAQEEKPKIKQVVEEVPKGDEEAVELPIITEIHEMKFSDIQDLAERFYEIMKFYKGDKWKLSNIKEHSKDLPQIIKKYEDYLVLGGIKSPVQREELLSAVVESAQHAKNGQEFWHSISDHKTMAAKSAPDRFYRAIVAGLQENENQASQDEELPMAA